MNIRHRVPALPGIIAFVAFAGACAGPLFGQSTPPPASGSPAQPDTVTLSPFVVSADQVGRYQSTEATSGGRVRVSVLDAPQSVSVIPLDLMLDISSTRVLDAAKYVSGITESILPGGLDRTTIRGFQQDGTTVDGFTAGNQQGNIDPILVERMEVVKGPNAVLSPNNGNAPGGTINLVTRKPQFRNFGSVAYQIARYDGNHASFDVNHMLNDSWAFRMVGATFHTKVYPEVPVRNTTVMPMVTWRSKTGAQLTAQFEYFHFHDQNYLGIPLDPSIGATGEYAKIWSILPRDLNLSDNDYRDDQRKEARLLLTAPLSDTLNMRLAVRYAKTSVTFAQNIPGPSVGSQTGGGINPLTGLYTPGFIYGPAPTFTASPAAPAALVLGRNGNDPRTYGPLLNVQNDYVHEFKSSLVNATSLGGMAYNYSKLLGLTINADRPTINYAAPQAGLPFVERDPATSATAIGGRTNTITISEQAYLSETVKFLDDKIALNGSYSYNNFDVDVLNMVKVAPTAAVPTPQQSFVADIDTQLKSYGAVVKPIPSVVVY
jgi:iron complex outermembrane recepter protein